MGDNTDDDDLWLPTEFPYEYSSLPSSTLHSSSSLNTTTQKSTPFLQLRNDCFLDHHHTSPGPSLFIKPPVPNHCLFPHHNYVKQARVIKPRHQMGNNFHFPLHIQKTCFTPNIHPQIYNQFLQNPNFVTGAYYNYNGLNKNPSAGTGVFLPRKYSNSTDSRKKTGQVSRGRVSQPLEKNTIPMVTHFQPQTWSCLDGGFCLQYDN